MLNASVSGSVNAISRISGIASDNRISSSLVDSITLSPQARAMLASNRIALALIAGSDSDVGSANSIKDNTKSVSTSETQPVVPQADVQSIAPATVAGTQLAAKAASNTEVTSTYEPKPDDSVQTRFYEGFKDMFGIGTSDTSIDPALTTAFQNKTLNIQDGNTVPGLNFHMNWTVEASSTGISEKVNYSYNRLPQMNDPGFKGLIAFDKYGSFLITL